MKQVEKIWAELSAKAQEVETPQESTELSEEVELSSVNELADLDNRLSKTEELGKKYFDRIEPAAKKARELKEEIRLGLSDLEFLRKQIADAIRDGDMIMKEFANNASEIGIDPNTNNVYKKLKSGYTKSLVDLQNKASKFQQELKSL